ncbi:FmdB family zinc ribbon protein [Candidatus Riflebacteria bacterium]
MPIFEYHCEGCCKDFELLLRKDKTPQCPFCKGKKLKKKFSVFNSPKTLSKKTKQQDSPCATCPEARVPGGCPRLAD